MYELREREREGEGDINWIPMEVFQGNIYIYIYIYIWIYMRISTKIKNIVESCNLISPVLVGNTFMHSKLGISKNYQSLHCFLSGTRFQETDPTTELIL